MTSEFLPIIIKNALEENGEVLPSVLQGKIDLAGILAFCGNFRAAGIAALFLGADTERFQQLLQCSGRAFAHFLGIVDEQVKQTSKSLPFFDAVASGDFEGAELLARRSRRSWAQGEEYEEDFLFVEFCMQWFFLGAPLLECEALLGRYEAALQGAEDSRLPICRSLLAGDSQAFNSALELFLAERSARVETLAMNDRLSEEERATSGNLSVEGLALLRFAERRGMEVERDYLHVPSTARGGGERSFLPDAWMRLWS